MRYDFQQPVPKKPDPIHKNLMIVYFLAPFFFTHPNKEVPVAKISAQIIGMIHKNTRHTY